jgi:hypothetical protein
MTCKFKERHGMAWHGKERQGKTIQGKVREQKERKRQGKAMKARKGNEIKGNERKGKKRKGKTRLGIDHIMFCGFPIHLESCTLIHGVGYLGIHTSGVVSCMHILGGNIPCGHLAFELD